MRAFNAAVGAVAVAALLAGCSGSSESKDGSARSDDGKVSVRFKVESNLPLNISMTGTRDSGGHIEEFKKVKTPWSKTVKVEKGRYPGVSVAPVDAAKKGEVRCEMQVSGKLVDEDSGTGTGPSLVVDCSGAT
ncbi:hypothetical protein ACIRPT_08270 [Streptomyces sp. NPDC101227]|uniref:hypothetical protein n=1 Tax=Streptomyces sp. NPDC101227 TaxID=3366136 RepID=UPI0038099294